MYIDPRLQDAALKELEPHPHNRTLTTLSDSYALNPIRLPPPHGLPSLTQEPSHPYYVYQQDSGSRPVPNQSSASQPHDQSQAILRAQGDGDRRDETKRPRACEACRGLKVRCVPDPAMGTCRRCSKAGRQCIVTLPSRKRQKKTDGRVAELEKKIDALTATLQATKSQGLLLKDEDTSGEEDADETSVSYGQDSNNAQLSADKDDHTLSGSSKQLSASRATPSVSGKRRRSDYQDDADTADFGKASYSRTLSSGHVPNMVTDTQLLSSRPRCDSTWTQGRRVSQVTPVETLHEYADVIDRKILDAENAAKLFQHYTTVMTPHMPVVVFPPGTTAGDVRKTKPVLFLAILSAASASGYPSLQQKLLREVTRVYADAIICKGEKSLELIQALQISTLWYSPEDYKDAKPYQLMNMASSMAISLGLGQRKKFFTGLALTEFREPQSSRGAACDTGTIESRRAWLGCYVLSGIAAMGLKQPNMLHWNSYLDECIKTLDTSPDAIPSDRIFAHWAKLQRLKDEILLRFETDDACTTADTRDVGAHYLKEFQEQLSNWEAQKPKDVSSASGEINDSAVSLTLSFYVSIMHIHLIDIRLRCYADDFEEADVPIVPHKLAKGPGALETSEVDAVTDCVRSIHKVLDIFLSFTVEDVRTIPTFHFVRIALAVVCLVRLHRAVTKPGSELGVNATLANSMEANTYMIRLHDFMQKAAAEEKCRAAHNFQLALRMMRTWFRRCLGTSCLGTGAESKDNQLKLEAQPIDAERSTPRQGYRTLTVHTGKPSGQPSPREASKPRTPPQQQQQRREMHVQPPSVQTNSQPQPQYHASLTQPADTPLHLLSQLATGDPSASTHQMQATASGEAWYCNNYPSHMAPQPMPMSYAPDYQQYYQNMPNYPDSGFTNNVNTSYPGMDLDLGLDQAMGVTFGEEGDLMGMFMGDYLPNAMQAHGVGNFESWEAGAQ
ncbi:hypothetical protein MMC13_002823 [Lambiella insularis]|nr:hypothetical protein [Lambiella insularis]